MDFTWVDIIALAILALGIMRGWRAGFIVMAGNIASLIVGLVVSTYIFYWLSSTNFLTNWHYDHPYVSIIIFILVLLLVIKLLRLLVALLNQIWRVIALLPFLSSFNRLLGAGIGLAESVIILIILVYLLQNFGFALPLSAETWSTIHGSLTFHYMSEILSRLRFLIPSIAIAT